MAIELAYVNTRHPDFDEARLIYRGLTDDGVDSSDLRKVSVHNAMTHGGTTGKQVVVVLSCSSLIHGQSRMHCFIGQFLAEPGLSGCCLDFYPVLLTPIPSNRHHRSNGDCLEGKRENYQVCSVQHCVQQLYTVNCTHI